jgi:hypothetical protein
VDAEVVVAGPGRQDPRFRRSRTSATGHAEFSLVAGDYGIRVTHPEFPVTTRQVTVGGASLDVDVALARGATLYGKVTDGTGQSIAGAELQALRSGTVERVQLATSEPDGSFQLPGLPLEPLDVVVRARAYRTRTLTFATKHHGDKDEVTIVLDRGQRITGRVVTQDGTVVDSAHVGCSDGSVAVVLTREDGSFELLGLANDPVNLYAIAEGYATKHVRDVTPGTRDLSIVVERPARIAGSVTVPEDAEYVDVAACRHDQAAGGELCLARVIVRPPESTYELTDVAPGDYDIVATAQGHGELRVPLHAATAGPVRGPSFRW